MKLMYCNCGVSGSLRSIWTIQD